MEWIYLGTSAGAPTRARNLSALAVWCEQPKEWLLIDCGEGTQYRVLETPLSLSTLRAILITHAHGDHCYGLPGLLASAGLQQRSKPLTLIAPQAVLNMLEAIAQHTELGLPFALETVALETLAGARRLGNLRVSAYPLSHRVPCWGFRLEECELQPQLDIERLVAEGIPRGPIWGRLLHEEAVLLDDGRCLKGESYRRLGRPRRVLLVAGDNGDPERLRTVSSGAHVLIHEATYTEAVQQQIGHAHGHSSAARIAAFAASAGLAHLQLTHFSARYGLTRSRGHSIEELRSEAQACYGGHLALARDLEHYRLNRDLSLERLGGAG